MPVAYGSSSTTGTSDNLVSVLDVPVPAGVIAGNHVFVAIEMWEAGNPAVTPAAGFSLLVEVVSGSTKLKVFWKEATGPDSGNYRFTWTGAQWTQGQAVRVTGAKAGNPVGANYATATSATGTAIPTTSLNVAFTPGLLHFVANENNALQSSAPTGFTEVQDASYLHANYRMDASGSGAFSASNGSLASSTLTAVVLVAIEPASTLANRTIRVVPWITLQPRPVPVFNLPAVDNDAGVGSAAIDSKGNWVAVYPAGHWNPICPQSWIRWHFAALDNMDPNSPTTPVFKTDARVVATSAITLSGLQTIDGVALTTGDRVLVVNQANTAAAPYGAHAANGIYTAAAGAWVRATDADAAGELPSGATVSITEGTASKWSMWTLRTANVTPGTTAQAWYRSGGDYPITLPHSSHLDVSHTPSFLRTTLNSAGTAITVSSQTVTEVLYWDGVEIDRVSTTFALGRQSDAERYGTTTRAELSNVAAGTHRVKSFIINGSGTPRVSVGDSLLTAEAWPLQFKYNIATAANGGGIL